MNALVVGGSSGIGLSIVLQLVQDTTVNHVYIIDKADFPKEFVKEKIVWHNCDLSLGDYSVLDGLDDIQALYITAGFGRLEWFQNLSKSYIDDIFAVNAIAPIQIIHHYYDKLLSDDAFYCAVMVSIAGRLSSPLFSVYSATKAALSKFIEAINVELDVQGSKNRILEVSPGSLDGTGFTGGLSHPELTMSLATEIIELSRKHETLFIPQYEEIFKVVIERYQHNPHQFGVDSYWYKKKQNRFE